MPNLRRIIVALLTSVALGNTCAQTAATPVATAAAVAPELRLVSRTELPGYTGDFDHFEVDLKNNRLWLAAEDHGTLDVFDLSTGKLLKSHRGIVDTPHGILYVPEKNRLIITDSGGNGRSKVIDTNTYKVTGTLKLPAPGADSMAYDPSRKRLYVVSGGRDAKLKYTFLSEVDPLTLKNYGDIKFDTDKVESIAIEQNGNRMYVNVTGKNLMAVIDKTKREVIATWPIKEAEQNAPLAFDEVNRRLFVVTRKPGKLIVLNADSGATVAVLKAPERCDQVFFDAINRRVYALGGEGYIGVFQQNGADQYVELARVTTAAGAKTGLLIPSLNRLYVAVSPGDSKAMAAVLQFEILPTVPASGATASRH